MYYNREEEDGAPYPEEEDGTLWVGVGCAGVTLGMYLLAGAWDLYACHQGVCSH